VTKERVLEISSVTPMLSHGADNKSPEIRIPEFKSAMRFWWRALSYFKSNGDKNFDYLKKMKSLEGKIFGDAKENASPISMKFKKLDKKFRTSKATKIIGEYDYNIKGFKAVEFKMSLALKYPQVLREIENWDFDKYYSLLEIVSVLGGIGQRARRGYGAFKIEDSDIYSNISLEYLKEKINGIFGEIYEVEESNYIKEENVIRRKKDYIPYCEFPFVEEIFIGKKEIEFDDYEKNMKKGIGKNFDADKFFEKNKYKFKRVNRYACPVYISACYKEETNKIIPVITILNNTHISKSKEYKEYRKYVLNIVGECIK
jgi:CRISPR-associated protein Cmr1